MKKNPEQTALTKEKIRDAFWNIYSERPIDQITVREIAELAGYNRSTFYTYFKDVYDILEQTEREILETLDSDSMWGCNILNRESYLSDIRKMEIFLRGTGKRLFIILGENGDPKFSHRLWQNLREKLMCSIKAVSDETDPVMLEYIAEYVMSCHSSIMLKWFSRDFDLSFEKVAELIQRLMTEGVVQLLAGNHDPYDRIADMIVNKVRQRIEKDINNADSEGKN